jgi:hypothetical protein
MNLGLFGLSGHPAVRSGDTASLVRDAASAGEAVAIARRLLTENPRITGEAIGEAVSVSLGRGWSRGSMKRCGGALRQWAAWLNVGEHVPA